METDRLGSEPIGRLVARMTLPTITAQIVNLLYVIVDRIFIGHIPEIGDTALTGIGIVAPIVTVISAFSSLFGNGGAPIAAVALSRHDKERAEHILGSCTSLLVVSAVLLAATAAVFSKPLLYLVGASSDTFPYASEYLSIYVCGTLSVLLSIGLAPFVIAQGGSTLVMISTACGCGVNILLDWLFVRVLDMNVAGAAAATVISQTISALILLSFLLFKAESMRLRPSCLIPDIKIVLTVLSIGVAPFIMSSTESLIGFVMNSSLRDWGGDNYVGCLTVMQSVMQFIGVPLSGFQQGVTAVVSYNYGAGNKERVKKLAWVILGVMGSYSILVSVSAMIFPSFFAGIFTDQPDLIGLTEKYLPIFICGMNIFGIQRCCQTMFLSLEQAKISLFIALLRKVFLLVPLVYILPNFFGVSGIYYAEPIADATAAISCGVIFLCVIKKALNKPAV
ncbi:MAG: MATE family efflux transporter [Clostridia bacterium]|nr:MATE family efflux transporter [Clostridia bacterium]